MQTLFLVRHGESEWNREGRIQGHLDSDLSDLGREQARLVGLELAKKPIRFAATSTAVRALETCTLALGAGGAGIPVEESALIREINLGVWEGRTAIELKKSSPGQVDLWFHRPSLVRIEGGETLRAFRLRIMREMNRLRADHRDETMAVFTHGGVICTYLTGLLKMKLDDMWRFKILNGSITKIIFPMEKPRIELLGSVHHLDGAMRDTDQSHIPGFTLTNPESDTR
jgi:broad specificity phosphatase PhoE